LEANESMLLFFSVHTYRNQNSILDIGYPAIGKSLHSLKPGKTENGTESQNKFLLALTREFNNAVFLG
jgi:hypothetical protein